MTPEAQRIAIAEACGWSTVINCGIAGGVIARSPKGEFSQYLYNSHSLALRGEAPDYLSDLNAIHEAEKLMSLEQCLEFTERVGRMENIDISRRPYSDRFTWHASAAQRAEAFLRTIGKWEDDK